MGFAAEFDAVISSALIPALEASRRLALHPELPRVAPAVLLNQHHVVRATPGLLGAALSRSVGALREYLRGKVLDEAGHDTLMAGDLARLGIDPDAPPDPNIVAMVGSQSYLIEHVHPAAFLGYIGTLEWFPPSVAGIEGFEDAAGIPIGSLSCARVHSRADPNHREDLARMMDALPAELHEGVLSNAMHSALFQSLSLEAVLRQADANTEKRAA